MYYLSKLVSDRDQIEYRPLCKLSKEQYAIIIQNESPLHNVLILRSLYEMFNKNTDELLAGIDSVTEQCEIKEEIIPHMPDVAKIELNRLLFNCLFSFRTFIDHSESFVKKYYGKSSKQAKVYSDEISYIYDTSFEYRFMYKLRNFAQHCGLPINHLSTKYYKYYNSISIEVFINFKIDDMLKDYDSWGSVKNELILLKSDLSVRETVSKFRKAFERILLWLNTLYQEISTKSKQMVADLSNNSRFDELAITYTNDDEVLFIINSIFRYIYQFETM